MAQGRHRFRPTAARLQPGISEAEAARCHEDGADDKLRTQRITVVDVLGIEQPKTKEFLGVMKILNLENKVLVVDGRDNRNLYLSARNLPKVKMVASSGLNVYDLLNYEHLLISKQALLEIQEVLQK